METAAVMPVFKSGRSSLVKELQTHFAYQYMLQVNGACDYPSNIFIFATARTCLFSSIRIYYKTIYNHQFNQNTNRLEISNLKSSFSHCRLHRFLQNIRFRLPPETSIETRRSWHSRELTKVDQKLFKRQTPACQGWSSVLRIL